MKLYCHNIRGLGADKLNNIDALLRNEYDVALINETWFSNHNALVNNEHFITHSTRPIKPQISGHENGGLAILAKCGLKQHIQLLFQSQYVLMISVHDIKIMFCYLPPQLKDDTITQILNDIKQFPDVLLGDFNFRLGALNDDAASTEPIRRKIVFQYAARHNMSWRKRNSGEVNRVDHIFSRDGLLNSWQFEQQVFNSDHGFMNILLNISVAEETPQLFRYNIRKLNDESICEEFKKTYQNFDNMYCDNLASDELLGHSYLSYIDAKDDQSLIDEVYDSFVSRIHDISKQVLGVYNVGEVKVNQDTLFEETRKAAEDSTVTKAVMIFKRANRGQQVKIEASQPDLENEYSEATRLFTKIFNNENKSEDIKMNFPRITHDIPPFSIEKIGLKIEKYSSTKSCGLDSLHIKIFKALCRKTSMVHEIYTLFCLFFRHGMTPTEWNTGLTLLQAKQGKIPIVENTRPITLTPVLRRIYESLLHEQWSQEDWASLHICQAGARRGYSVLTQALVNDHLSKTGYKHTVLLDISKAFDTVPHERLIKRLKDSNAPLSAIKIIYSLFTQNMKTSLVINHSRTEDICIKNGIFQGSVLSPFLFELYIDTLLNTLNPNGTFTKALAYVDDVALKEDKGNDELQASLAKCEAWSKENNVFFNVSKCIELTSKPQSDLLLYGKRLKTAKIEKYLGVQTSNRGIEWSVFIHERIKKARGVLNLCKVKGVGWPEILKIYIYKCFIQCNVDFLGPAIDTYMDNAPKETKATILKTADEFFKDVIKWIFNTDSSSGIKLLQSLTMLRNIPQRWKELRSTFVATQEKLSKTNPLCLIKEEQKTGPWSTTNIAARIFFKQPINKEYAVYLEGIIPPSKPITLDTFKDKKFISYLESKDALPKYITMESRNTKSYIDNTLYPIDDAYRVRFIAWRRNRAYMRRNCPVCERPFNKGHVNRCHIFTDLLSKKDYCHKREVAIIRDRKKFEDMDNYSLLDCFINSRQYELALECFLDLESRFT